MKEAKQLTKVGSICHDLTQLRVDVGQVQWVPETCDTGWWSRWVSASASLLIPRKIQATETDIYKDGVTDAKCHAKFIAYGKRKYLICPIIGYVLPLLLEFWNWPQ